MRNRHGEGERETKGNRGKSEKRKCRGEGSEIGRQSVSEGEGGSQKEIGKERKIGKGRNRV